MERTEDIYKVLTLRYFTTNCKAGNALLFRGKSCWFIFDGYPLVYEHKSSKFRLSILAITIWLNSKLHANILDYILGEATVLGYQTVTWNCNLLVPSHCYDPFAFTFLYYTLYFTENYWVGY